MDLQKAAMQLGILAAVNYATAEAHEIMEVLDALASSQDQDGTYAISTLNGLASVVDARTAPVVLYIKEVEEMFSQLPLDDDEWTMLGQHIDAAADPELSDSLEQLLERRAAQADGYDERELTGEVAIVRHHAA